MLSKGRLRETVGTSVVELVDAPIVAVCAGANLRVWGGSMIRIFFTSNPSGGEKKKKK